MGVFCSKPGATSGSSRTYSAKRSKSGKSEVSRQDSDRSGFRAGMVRHKRDKDIWKKYNKMSSIGQGLSGTVIKISNKATGETFACKPIRKSTIEQELLDDLRNEIELLTMMDHPNIIKLYETYEDATDIYLVMELCAGGELFDRLLKQETHRFTEAEAGRIVGKMLSAISYCHTKQISHRDLKLENFVFEDATEASNIKLIDFGLSRKYGSENMVRRMTTMVGTAYYIAPEVLKGSGYTSKVDIWSIGVIAYMLLSGKPPFAARQDSEIIAKVKKGHFDFKHKVWTGVSSEAKEFVRGCLQYKPHKRFDAEQALQHSWIRRQFSEARRASGVDKVPEDVLLALRKFRTFSSIKRAALEAVVFSMNAKELAELRAVFESIDEDKTGTLTWREFEKALVKAGMSESEAHSVFTDVNQDGASTVSYTEFLAASLSRRFLLNETRLNEAFDRLDVDGSGFITLDNLKEVLRDDFTPARASAMIQEADRAMDGRISKEEFLKLFKDETQSALSPLVAAELDGASHGAGAGAGAGSRSGSAAVGGGGAGGGAGAVAANGDGDVDGDDDNDIDDELAVPGSTSPLRSVAEDDGNEDTDSPGDGAAANGTAGAVVPGANHTPSSDGDALGAEDGGDEPLVSPTGVQVDSSGKHRG